MQRRSFFGAFTALVGGLTLTRVRRPPTSIVVVDPAAPYYGPGGKYRFGFTGFKPAEESWGVAASRDYAKGETMTIRMGGAPESFHYHPMEGRFYKPGDRFEIIGPAGRGTARMHKVLER